MGHGEDQSGARQDRTRGRGRTRVVPGSTGPEGMEGRSRGGPREQETAVGKCTPEGARGAGQGRSTEWPSLKQQQQQQSQFQSKPASDERVGQGAQVSSSFTSLKQGVGLYIG
ncbi:uncharacterized [Lates japonicus]